jgi:hypothetical protein
MNKAELLQYLHDLPFVDSLLGIKDTGLAVPKGVDLKLYVQSYLEVMDNVGIGRNLYFYVVDEGSPTERAYFKDMAPTQQTMKHELEIKYEAQIAASFGKVIASGADFIVVDGYEESGADMVPATWFLKEVDGTPIVKKVVK